GISSIIILDRLGAQAVRERMPEAICIWIYPKSIAILRERLVLRSRDSAQAIEKRLALAEREMKLEEENPFFSHHLCNDLFHIAVNDLKNFIHSQFLDPSSKNSSES